MGKVTIVESVTLPIEPGETYDFFTSPEAYRMFTGFGPIPGIREVVWEQGEAAALGSIGRVHNTDGSTHRERVTQAERGRAYDLAIDEISSAFRHMVARIEEHTRFEPANADGSHTRITRTFRFHARSVAFLPVLQLISKFFRGAVVKNHQRFKRHYGVG